jgi:FkbM family methyltransferase
MSEKRDVLGNVWDRDLLAFLELHKNFNFSEEIDCFTDSFSEIWSAKVYTYCKEVQRGMTVLDVGSCFGSFSIYAVAKGAKKVYALEAQPVREAKQKEVIKKLNLSDVIVSLPYALWFKEANLRIEIDHINLGAGEYTKAMTLDQFVKDFNIEKVDFIKIDTEGCELPIIAGAQTTIRRDHPIFAIAAYHERHYTVNGEWLDNPAPPTITKKSQMDAIITLFKQYPEYTYTIKSEGWAMNEMITFFLK